jgi:nicotinamide-nucleotide amidase
MGNDTGNDKGLDILVTQLSAALMLRGWSMCTAESCTGGLIAASCTALAGSSEWFERGFVTYSNASKSEILGVDAALIQKHGAVSEEVARAMALGGLRHSRAQVCLAVTGVAGPTGGSPEKPVGTVWFAWALPSDEGPTVGADAIWISSGKMQFTGGRKEVREQTVVHSFNGIAKLLSAK